MFRVWASLTLLSLPHSCSRRHTCPHYQATKTASSLIGHFLQACTSRSSCQAMDHSICPSFLLSRIGLQPHNPGPTLIVWTSLVPNYGITSPRLWACDNTSASWLSPVFWLVIALSACLRCNVADPCSDYWLFFFDCHFPWPWTVYWTTVI